MPLIYIASYPFKGTYTSSRATRLIAGELDRFNPGVIVALGLLGDGGAGTLEALLTIDGSRAFMAPATIATGKREDVAWGRGADGTAVIEAATVIGLAKIAPGSRDPLGLVTRGIGELVGEATTQGAHEIWIGLGDTATHDCGLGMAAALGYRFFDAAGVELPPIGRSLPGLASIDRSDVLPVVETLQVTGLCDVLNTLTGPDGAARRFLNQKGGTAGDIEVMEDAALRFCEIVRRDLGITLEGIAGAGAAGGLGAGIVAFLGGRLTGGAERVLDAIEFDSRIANADLVITGEGRVDRGTMLGKGTGMLAERARRAGVPTLIVAGSIDGDRAELEAMLGATIITLVEAGEGTTGSIESIGDRLREEVTRLTGIR